jgi:hypothetical protein
MSQRRPQISATVDQEVYEAILELAKKQDRTHSDMTALLLKQAVKDKTRNRKGAKKDNAEHNTG